MSKNIQKAVVLKYNKEKDRAPKIKAKGKGVVAKNIIKIAKKYDLPIKKDEDLVELLSKVEMDKEIPQNLYKAVAEVFQFIYKLSKK